MHRLVFSPAVLRKLDSTYDYIAHTLKTPKAASSTIADILDYLDILKNNPDIGPRLSSRIDDVPARYSETRFLVSKSHIAVYEHDDKTVQILGLYHGREDFFGRIISELD
jgi:plasmid stabilization system protein ParE